MDVFHGSRLLLFFSRIIKCEPGFVRAALRRRRVFTRLSAAGRECVCVCVGWGEGFCWMSHIVPVRPSDIAGGQGRMEPERGDSDK